MLFQDLVLTEMKHDDHQEMLEDGPEDEVLDSMIDEAVSVDIFNDEI